MEFTSYQGVSLAELLPRIPDSIKDGLPFGLVKLDLKGTILEYNMAEGELTGVDPAWALGKSFFDEVALCTKTQAFYGRFLEGVKKGFLNAVFDYTFDHRQEATRVRVHMVMMPDHLGRKTVMVLVKRTDKPVVFDAFAGDSSAPDTEVAELQTTGATPPSVSPATPPVAAAGFAVDDIVRAVIAALNQGIAAPAAVASAVAGRDATPAVTAAPVAASTEASFARPAAGSSRHEDIIKF